MHDPELRLPFLTREMLKFGNKATIEVVIQSRATVAANVKIRMFTRSEFSEYTHTTDTGSTPDTERFRVTDFPIMISVVDDGGSFKLGECYITLSIAINGEIVYELGSGFVYLQKSVSWPGNKSQDTIPGHGRFKEVTLENPAAGAELDFAIPAHTTWRILAHTFNLVTTSGGSARRVMIRYTAPGGLDIHSFSSADQAASTTRKYSAAHYGALLDDINVDRIIIPIPSDIWLQGTSNLVTETTNLAAGDNFGSHFMLVEEFLVEDTES